MISLICPICSKTVELETREVVIAFHSACASCTAELLAEKNCREGLTPNKTCDTIPTQSTDGGNH